MSWIDKCVHYLYTEIFIEIRKVINYDQESGIHWSSWVNKIWDLNYEHVVHLNFLIVL